MFKTSRQSGISILVASITVLFFSSGCSQASDAPEPEEGKSEATSSGGQTSSSTTSTGKSPPREIHLEKLPGSDSGGLNIPDSLCSLLKAYGDRMGGLYTVADIVQRPYEHPGKTFIHLEQHAGWGENPVGDITIEFDIGPTPEGKWEGTPFYSVPELSVGEQIVTFFQHYKEHKYIFPPHVTFRKTGSGYTNGHLFARNPVSLDTLKTNILDLHRGLQSGNGCPYNVSPAAPPSSSDTGKHPRALEDAPDADQVRRGTRTLGADGGN